MQSAHRLGLAVLACGFVFADAAKAALQVELGEVNTSVNVKPTTTANKWKLQTDPSVDPSITGPDFSTYIVGDGALSNSYDPTKFTLATNPTTSTYGLGFTVEGLGAYEVTGFTVEMNGGGTIKVQANATPGGPDVVTDTGTVNQGEAGVVEDVEYQLIPDRIADALPANMDQFFYEINLNQIGTNPNFDPGVVTVFGDAGSFLTVQPMNPGSGNPPITTLFNPTSGPGGGPNFQTNTNVPEPTSLGLLAIGAFGLLGRRRKVFRSL
jgi:PEP-CTERM motif